MKQQNSEATPSSKENNSRRPYRDKLVSAGQSSPLILGENVAEIIQKVFVETLKLTHDLSILDIGCGLGRQMTLIKSALPGLFNRIEGIDWSPATVEKHNSGPASVFDKVTLCSSEKIPYKDREFDIALSMENLEHLYEEVVIGALQEMARIAKYLIITTPLPQACINHAWLYREIAEAILDPDPISQREFICLESAVHKSTLFPDSMHEAGFIVIKNNEDQAFYIGESSKIDFSKIKYVGISSFQNLDSEPITRANYKETYLTLLAKSAQLSNIIASVSTS